MEIQEPKTSVENMDMIFFHKQKFGEINYD